MAAWYDHALQWTLPSKRDNYAQPVHTNAAWTEQRPFFIETEEEKEDTEHWSRANNLQKASFVSKYATTLGATELENNNNDLWRELVSKHSEWIQLQDTFNSKSLQACWVLECKDVIAEKK